MKFIIEQSELNKLKDDFNIENPLKSDLSCLRYITDYLRKILPEAKAHKINLYSDEENKNQMTCCYYLTYKDSETLLSFVLEVDRDNKNSKMIDIYYPSEETI